MLVSIKKFGINGAALTYMVAASIDALVMYIMVYRIGAINIWPKNILILFVFILISLTVPFLLL